MKNSIKIPNKIKNIHDYTKKMYPIFVFAGFCGIGKTTVVRELLKNGITKAMTFDGEDFKAVSDATPIILFENAHNIKDADIQQEITRFIHENKEKQFYFLTRSELPNWLVSFQLAGKLQVFYEPDFRLNQEEIEDFFSTFTLAKEEIMEIHDETEGYPLYLSLISNYLKEGNPYSNTTFLVVKERMFHYITEQVFTNFSANARNILLSLALFEQYDIEFIKMVSGELNITQIIDEIQGKSNVFIQKKRGIYEVSAFFREYLLWKLQKEYTDTEIRQLYSSAGRYYELNDQIYSALECYKNSKEDRKIVKILVDNSNKNPSLGDYLETEPYYLALPEEEIRKTPSLMAGMSMLKAMRANYESSSYWHHQLQEYANRLKKNDGEYKSVKATLIYLDIALPQSGTNNLLEVFPHLFRLLTNKELDLPRFSITSLLPSVLNGGKDFSSWTKNDFIIYKTMRLPCEAMLGKDGIGTFDCAICESLFEKDQNYVPYLLQAVAKLSDIQQNGTHEIEFYLMGLMARIQVSQGNSDEAKATLITVRERFDKQGDKRFFPNIQAMLCKINLLQGDYQAALAWIGKDAPENDHEIWSMLRYQYLIKCEVYLQQGNFLQALCLLSQLQSYTVKCNRPIDQIHTNILTAVCYYRQNNLLWKENLSKALEIAYEYSYVYPISQYGVAILPLLTGYKVKKEDPHFSKIVLATRNQASIYQRYLEPVSGVQVQLSPTELSVLRLICQNKSNSEIGVVLDIKLPTVKGHVANIFKKMKVSRRSEAKTLGKQLNLIDEHLAK